MELTDATPLVNTIKDHVASLVRAIVDAGQDTHLSWMEAMRLGMHGTTLATTLMALLRDAPPELRAAVVTVLEQGVIVIRESDTTPAPSNI